MPNRRRRKLSTAMSAVAALAVASPIALVAAAQISPAATAPQHREFVQAALVTDLPNDVVSALSQGLSQFGVNLPPVAGILTGANQAAPTTLTSPGLASPGLTSPGLTSPGLTSPGLTSPGLTSPGLTSPSTGLTTPGLTSPSTGLTAPGLTPPAGATAPGLTPPSSLASPAGLTSPGLTSPGLTTPGLSTPSVSPGLGGASTPMADPNASLGLGPGEGLGGSPGTYPILGDPNAGMGLGPGQGLGGGGGGGGGLISDLSSAANQLGATQAIDLLKGMVMPAIMSAVKSAGPAAAAAAPAAAAPAIP